ncbi:MAG: hypothetical protein ACD_78C00230G0003, partial [uncultured bacterium (gcode 4)]
MLHQKYAFVWFSKEKEAKEEIGVVCHNKSRKEVPTEYLYPFQLFCQTFSDFLPKKRAPWERPSYYRRVWDSPHRHTKGVSGTMRGKTKTMCCRTTQLPRISRDTHPCHGLLLAARAGVGVGDCLA